MPAALHERFWTTTQGAFHVKLTPKERQALSFHTPCIFREREAAKNQNLMVLRNVQYWPKFLVSYQKKLLKDRGQLHIHAKVTRVSNPVMPRTNFAEEVTPLRQQKSRVYGKDLRA